MAMSPLRASTYETCHMSREGEKAGMGLMLLEVGLMKKKWLSCRGSLIVTVAIFVFSGCGSDYSSQIVDLQKQIALLSRQIEEMQKEIRVLRDTGANIQQSLHDAEAEINRLKTLETLPAGTMSGGLEEEELKTSMPVPVRRGVTKAQSQKAITATTASTRSALVSCSQVWELLGKGKGTEEIATILHTTVEHAALCEQKVGRNTIR